MPDLKVYTKAIAAFIAGVLANMVSDLANGQAPWPQSAGEWLRYTLTSVGAATAAYAVPNRPKLAASSVGTFEIVGDKGRIDVSDLLGPAGTPGEPAPIINMQADDTTPPPADTLGADDHGKAWLVGNDIHVYDSYVGDYRVMPIPTENDDPTRA